MTEKKKWSGPRKTQYMVATVNGFIDGLYTWPCTPLSSDSLVRPPLRIKRKGLPYTSATFVSLANCSTFVTNVTAIKFLTNVTAVTSVTSVTLDTCVTFVAIVTAVTIVIALTSFTFVTSVIFYHCYCCYVYYNCNCCYVIYVCYPIAADCFFSTAYNGNKYTMLKSDMVSLI